VRQATFKMAPPDPINASKEGVFPSRSNAQLSESLLDSYEANVGRSGPGWVRRMQAAGVGPGSACRRIDWDLPAFPRW
jgi:hypothetical protein